MKLWLVRHAQPLIEPGICYGRLDVAADADATADCARRLALELPAGMRVVVSPLQRCAQLARALQALRPDLAFHTDVRLQEMDFGRWEGCAWSAIAPAELQAWTDDFAHYAVGGTGESVSAFMARVGAAFDALALDVAAALDGPNALADAAGQPSHSQTHAPVFQPAAQKPTHAALWITHAGVIRAAGLLAQGMRHIKRADQWPLHAPNYGQWQTLDLHAGPANRQETDNRPAPMPGSACG